MTAANTTELGGGFFHHGIPNRISTARGTVATVDNDGNNVILVWLFDHRGGYGLQMVNPVTGNSEHFPIPFDPGDDCPYASILSSRNRFYTHFNGHFVEFDVAEKKFTFSHETAPRVAMAVTEDDGGVIWMSTLPQSGLVSFDPETSVLTDFGHVYEQNWRQYPTTIASDDTGWIYFGIGTVASQIIAFDRSTGEANPLLAEEDRSQGSASVYRDLNGKVYGLPPTDGPWAGDHPDVEVWLELYRGETREIPRFEDRDQRQKPYRAGLAYHFDGAFPDGKKLTRFDMMERVLTVEKPNSGGVSNVAFDYPSEGARMMGMAAAPDGTICGGTFFPRIFFSYNPQTDEWIDRESFRQWNTVVRQGDRLFVGGYSSGFLIEWDPSKPWVTTEIDEPRSNPFFHTQCKPTIHRPHYLLAHPNGKTLVMAGTPGYGLTGGGLLFWDRETNIGTLLEHTEILPYHSTMCLAPMPDEKLLGGTTTLGGTGGEQKVSEAELYVMDLETKQIEWRSAAFPGAQVYTDLCKGIRDVVYGFVDRKQFFVFDPVVRAVVHEEDTGDVFGLTNDQQGPRVFVTAPNGNLYVLFEKGIALIDQDDHSIEMIAESPVPIGPGGDFLDGRIYFGSGSHLYSYDVGDPTN